MLASVTALGATAKTKTITLHDPDVPVQLSFSGTMYDRLAAFSKDGGLIACVIGHLNGVSPGRRECTLLIYFSPLLTLYLSGMNSNGGKTR